MAKIKIDGNILITYEHTPYKQIYWDNLSKYIINKYGDSEIHDYQIVDECLNDCFLYLIKEFENIVSNISNFKFFCYVFRLHEESLKLMIKERSGRLNLYESVNESDFARYRRVLKIIMEQGCKNKLSWGQISKEIILQFDDTIQRLFYIATWLYQFADNIAYHRMLNGAYFIHFEKDDLVVHWKNNYGSISHRLLSYFSKGYESNVYDEHGTTDLRHEIEKNFRINYDDAFSLVFHVKNHHSDDICQTVEPQVLPINLREMFPNVSQSDLENLIAGLTLSIDNCLSLKDTILKPYSTERFLFRPYLVYNINGEARLLTSEDKFAESMYVLATNAVQWNTINIEWRKNKQMELYVTRKGNEHDRHLENEIEKILHENKLLFARNVKSFKTNQNNNVNIDNNQCGEIDFIILDTDRKHLIVADSKYNKTRFEGVGYRQDYSNFRTKNEPQLFRKLKWINENKEIVQQHFDKIYPNNNLAFNDFEVKGLFIINTPSFYMFCSKYLTIAIKYLDRYFKNEDIYPDITVEFEPHKFKVYPYPYFKES